MAINTSPSFNPGGGMSFRVISQEDRSAAPAEAARVICQERITGGRSRMAIPASHAGRQGSPPGVTTIPEPEERTVCHREIHLSPLASQRGLELPQGAGWFVGELAGHGQRRAFEIVFLEKPADETGLISPARAPILAADEQLDAQRGR